MENPVSKLKGYILRMKRSENIVRPCVQKYPVLEEDNKGCVHVETN